MSIVNCHIMSHCITPQNKASFVPGHGSKPMAGMNPTWCWRKRYASPPPAPDEGHFLKGVDIGTFGQVWNSPWYPLVGLQPLMPSWGKREWSGLVLLSIIYPLVLHWGCIDQPTGAKRTPVHIPTGCNLLHITQTPGWKFMFFQLPTSKIPLAETETYPLAIWQVAKVTMVFIGIYGISSINEPFSPILPIKSSFLATHGSDHFRFRFGLPRRWHADSAQGLALVSINHPFGNGNHTTYKNGDDWGWLILWHCFTHINTGFFNTVAIVYLPQVKNSMVSFVHWCPNLTDTQLGLHRKGDTQAIALQKMDYSWVNWAK